MSEPGFWDRPDAAREVMAESTLLKGWVEPWTKLNTRARELVELGDLLLEEPDEELEAEWGRELTGLEGGIGELELRTMLQGENDHRGAILTIHPGAGGTESQDWAEMLLRMYQR